MSYMLPTVYILLLLGSLLLGLILLAAGAVLWLRVKNKTAGILLVAAGLVLTACPVAVLLWEVITVRT